MRLIFLSVLLVFSFLTTLQGQYTLTIYDSSNTVIPNNKIWSVNFDSSGNKWIGVYDFRPWNIIGGIVKYDNVEWEHILLIEDTLYGKNNISDIIFDSNSDMWICSYSGNGSKITRFDGQSYHDMTPSSSAIGTKGIFDDNSIWFLDPWYGLFEFDLMVQEWKTHTNFGIEHYDESSTLINIDSNGVRWIGGDNKIFLNTDTSISSFQVYPDPGIDDYYHVIDIEFASDGSIWIATTNGLARQLKNGEFIYYHYLNSGLPELNLTAIEEDNEGNIWVGTREAGIAVFNGSTWLNYSIGNTDMKSNEIWDINVEKTGAVWVATWGGGVLKFTKEVTSASDQSIFREYLFPNPVSVRSEIYIANPQNEVIRNFTLISIEGKVLRSYSLSNCNDCSIDLSGILKGVYIGIISKQNGESSVHKITIVE